MPKQTPPQETRSSGPRPYIVMQVVDDVTTKRLGIVKARDADRAMAQFLNYDPQELAAVPVARWTQRKDMCLRNKPETDLGEPVEIHADQLELDAAA